MKFSIVISTYNRLSLLKRAIHSALTQTVPCEVVIADDCSIDETESYVRHLGDQVLYHRNDQNSGHSATVNAGVQVATGDWIKFIDDDDYLAPNCIEEMIQAIALHPEAVLCSCQAAQVDEHEIELRRTPRIGPGLAFYIPQEDIHYGMLLELVPFGTPVQVACHREAFVKSGGWDSALDANCDDIDSWVRIAQFGDAIFINQCLAYRTIWPGAYNKKFSIQKRLETNILIKNKIAALVAPKYTAAIPLPEQIASYLHLHWSIVAFRNTHLIEAIQMAFPHSFCLKAWQLLIGAILSRQIPQFLPENAIDRSALLELAQEPSSFTKSNWQHLRAYFKLRGSGIALRQGQFSKAFQLAYPSIFSFTAWKWILKSLFFPKDFKLSGKFRTNSDRLLLQERIYDAIQKRYRCAAPEAQQVLNYLKLNWGLGALKQRQWLTGIYLIFPAIFSKAAWKMLGDTIFLQNQQGQRWKIRKFVLIRSYPKQS